MYILDLGGLVNDWKLELVNQKEQAKYLIGWLVLFYPYSGVIKHEPIDMLDWVLRFLVPLSVGCLVYMCYKENAKGDNKDFIARFLSLDFVYQFYLSIFLIGIVTVLILINMYLDQHGSLQDIYKAHMFKINMSLGFIYLIVKLLLIKFKIKEIANN